jgi:hypothetical protein
MVYRNRFVAAIKVGGKVLRETSDSVSIPFGSEYSILLKNLNSVRAQVKVSVDGKDATEGTWLIVEPNGSIDLERYIRDGNLDRGNRFKFIERTKDIEDHKGIGVEDGLVRVEYKMEQVVVEQPVIRTKYYDQWVPVERPYYYDPYWPYHPYPRRWPYYDKIWYGTNSLSNSSTFSSTSNFVGNAHSSGNMMAMNLSKCSEPVQDSAFNDAGITVPGSESSQRFVSGAYFKTESQSEVIVIKLRGVVAGKKVSAPVTIERKPKCSTCGKVNKGDALFCSKCGTALNLI